MLLPGWWILRFPTIFDQSHKRHNLVGQCGDNAATSVLFCCFHFCIRDGDSAVTGGRDTCEVACCFVTNIHGHTMKSQKLLKYDSKNVLISTLFHVCSCLASPPDILDKVTELL